MDNFYNLSKYISLKHIQKFRICQHWANEIYLSHRDKYDSIYDEEQRKRYNWLYLKKSLSNIGYIEDDNNMYYNNRKLKTIIKVIYMTDMIKEQVYKSSTTYIKEKTSYLIKSVKSTHCIHVVYVDTGNINNIFKLVNILIPSKLIKQANERGAFEPFMELMRSLKNWKYNSDVLNMINQYKFISWIADTICPDEIYFDQ